MNNMRLGGKYSSGTTAAVAVLDDLRPAPRAALIGRAPVVSAAPGPADLFNFFCASTSDACLRSGKLISLGAHTESFLGAMYPSQPTSCVCASLGPLHCHSGQW